MKIFTNFPPNLWKNTNGLKFCHWKIHFLGIQSHFSPKVLFHRIFSSPNAPFKMWAVYLRFTWWHDVSLSPSGTQAWEFSEKSRNSCFFGQNLCIFLPFHDVLGLFDKISCFFVKSPSHTWEQKRAKKKKKKKKKRWIDHFQEPFATRHDVLLSTSTPLLSHTKNRWRDDWPYWPQSFFQLALTLSNT